MMPTEATPNRSSSTSTKTLVRATLSNLGQLVRGSRLIRHRRPNEPNTQIISTDEHSVVEFYDQSSGSHPREAFDRHASNDEASLTTQLSQRHRLMNITDSIRLSIRSAIINRSSFEMTFQSITNEILSSDAEVSIFVINEIFQLISDFNIPFHSKALSLEVRFLSYFFYFAS